ncbi:MAG: ARMT1-like domain-containing protein [Oscillospiraceae bacterium]|nr:ARMT1-like domain-containing protein [Oscillospiraceae bacterium]
MRISESCADCLFRRQSARNPDPDYLAEVRRLIDNRSENDTAPLLVWRFNNAWEKRFGASDRYADVKRRSNDFMLELEDSLRTRIAASTDPLAAALAFARIGNYIDYGALDTVELPACMRLFDGAALREDEREVYRRFTDCCAEAERFLLIADNCGEIVLDKLFLEQLKLLYPKLSLQVLVRGREVLNDVTPQDAVYTGIDRLAEILSNGEALAGTVCDMLPEEARRAFDSADVILAKGQGNYESLSGQGRHIFYAFLCKCELFTRRFDVPLLTAMLVEEGT